jgi:small-conductance mechanosensitive channel
LVSALGVGIGFGLQNLVQNFVAGLILIFGRPINVGDRVEVGGLMGTVTVVGFRASVVKTFQGAEVIVPNSQFVSDQVINWSLSDETRRVELDVGVKYGTDPERVIQILREAAEGHPDVMDAPAPDPLFVGFGASSLDFQLRCWTAHGSAWLNIRSDLSISINRKLAEAGIEIPFPQRDLHLRSVDEDAARRLSGTDHEPPLGGSEPVPEG